MLTGKKKNMENWSKVFLVLYQPSFNDELTIKLQGNENNLHKISLNLNGMKLFGVVRARKERLLNGNCNKKELVIAMFFPYRNQKCT